MPFAYHYVLLIMWIAWTLYWWALAFNVKTTAKREPLASQFVHVAPLAVAVILLFGPNIPVARLGERLLPATSWPFWLSSALTAAGLLFTVWARRWLGRNWSAIVTIKENHEFVARGPYAMVRHPIYTGLLLAIVGTAVERGDLQGALAFGFAFWAFWRKIRVEEHWLCEHFGEPYAAYRRRVAALLPFVL